MTTTKHPTPDPREGFNIGWAYASHNAYLPDDAAPDLRQGYDAGRAHFSGRRCQSQPDRFVRKWLQLQANAWRRGRVFDQAVTPSFIEHITPQACPITREVLTFATGKDTDWSVDRLVNAAGYAPGNLVVMSVKANLAKDNLDYAQILRIAGLCRPINGLSPVEWNRMASMVGMTEDSDSLLPLLVVPPPRLLVSNPYTMLQLAMMYALAGRYTHKIEPALRQACHGKVAKRSLTDLLDTIAGRLQRTERREQAYAHSVFWWFEDAWCDMLLLRSFRAWLDTLADGDLEDCTAVARRYISAIRPIKGNPRAAWGEETNGYTVPEARPQRVGVTP